MLCSPSREDENGRADPERAWTRKFRCHRRENSSGSATDESPFARSADLAVPAKHLRSVPAPIRHLDCNGRAWRGASAHNTDMDRTKNLPAGKGSNELE